MQRGRGTAGFLAEQAGPCNISCRLSHRMINSDDTQLLGYPCIRKRSSKTIHEMKLLGQITKV